jgi:hypothetical protein
LIRPPTGRVTTAIQHAIRPSSSREALPATTLFFTISVRIKRIQSVVGIVAIALGLTVTVTVIVDSIVLCSQQNLASVASDYAVSVCAIVVVPLPVAGILEQQDATII